ncbi:UTP--glucose-1-phosphate uridylyltransferase GalU [Bacillus infantis]|uniref:UTP--glucose-1-phosphate uridylyltransferase GalU n=1 Tax=Bacillus infantis TaxID=324767 RepID=UPI001CD5CA3E|nr:UTP--glucose-1-phosphate uridylyltransferase GalU [Bacillus infantis]MCA1038214.1 UTP--glucose-1-phosphate uridylyltransferase GalU [Bacillus infantis]
MIRKAVIPAAGLGTRFLPATKAQPKEMLPVADKPAIQYIVEEAIASGIEDIIIITGRNKRAIEDHFDKSVELELMLKKTGKTELLKRVEAASNLASIHYVRQKEPLGLGHAVLCAKQFIGNEPFAVLLGDDLVDSGTPALLQMISQFKETGACMVGAKEIPWEDVSKYGIIDYSFKAGNLCKIERLVEKPPKQSAPTNQAIIGRYVLTPEVFPILETLQPDPSGEIQLTEALSQLLKKGPMYSCLIEGNRYDTGDKFGFLQASIEFALKNEEIKEKLEQYLYSLRESEKRSES